jgi:DNA-3-methyladenine glycosylase I
MKNEKERCVWAKTDDLMLIYHDKEWGVPLHDETRLFEMLILEGAQAGLSWLTILRKRENYRKAFDFFQFEKIARYDSKKVANLIADSGIIRNKLKIAAAIQNAKSYLLVQKEFGSFNNYIWQFVHNKSIQNKFINLNEYPSKTKESETMSKDLLKRGFKFVGPTICYAFMQAIGMVNDHQMNCFRYSEINKHKA